MATVLHYAITPDPFPLKASAEAGGLTSAILTLVATNATDDPVTLQGVVVQLPIGDGASALTDHVTDIGPVPPVTRPGSPSR